MHTTGNIIYDSNKNKRTRGPIRAEVGSETLLRWECISSTLGWEEPMRERVLYFMSRIDTAIDMRTKVPAGKTHLQYSICKAISAPYTFSEVMAKAEEGMMFVRTGNFLPGSHSYSYEIPKWKYSATREFYTFSNEFSERLRAAWTMTQMEQQAAEKRLQGWLGGKDVEADYAALEEVVREEWGVEGVVDAMLRKDAFSVSPHVLGAHTDEQKTRLGRWMGDVEVLRIICGVEEVKITTDSYSGRMHYFLTRTRSPYKKCFRIKGEQVAEVDVKCSQPSLLAMLLPAISERIGQDKKKFRREYAQYLRLITEGDIYQEAADWLHTDRKTVKKEVMHYLFKSPKSHKPNRFQKFMEVRMPLVHECVTATRTMKMNELCEALDWDVSRVEGIDMETGEEGDSYLPKILQFVESEIFIRGVLLHRDCPPCLPVHDCLMCAPSDAEQLKKMIQTRAKKILKGLKFQLQFG